MTNVGCIVEMMEISRQKLRTLIDALLIACVAGVALAAEPFTTLSLAGQWRFSLDTNQEGVQKEYFNREFSERIELPGSTDQAHFGTRNSGKPSLDGLFRLNLYEGPAWYQRDIEIPRAWRGKQVVLFLERSHWDSRVWMDSLYIGTQDSLIAPHVYYLGTNLAPGRHRLTICVDNTKDRKSTRLNSSH